MAQTVAERFQAVVAGVLSGHHVLDLSWAMKICPKCNSNKPFAAFYPHKRTKSGIDCHCKKCKTKDGKITYREIKTSALQWYSKTENPSCCCCGEARLEFLSLDHVKGGGRKHREVTAHGVGFYRWIKKNNFPDGFQTLCHNCNQAKWAYGQCPHSKDECKQ